MLVINEHRTELPVTGEVYGSDVALAFGLLYGELIDLPQTVGILEKLDPRTTTLLHITAGVDVHAISLAGSSGRHNIRCPYIEFETWSEKSGCMTTSICCITQRMGNVEPWSDELAQRSIVTIVNISQVFHDGVREEIFVPEVNIRTDGGKIVQYIKEIGHAIFMDWWINSILEPAVGISSSGIDMLRDMYSQVWDEVVVIDD